MILWIKIWEIWFHCIKVCQKKPKTCHMFKRGKRDIWQWGEPPFHMRRKNMFVIHSPPQTSANPAGVLWSTKCVRLFPFQTDPPATLLVHACSTHPRFIGPKPRVSRPLSRPAAGRYENVKESEYSYSRTVPIFPCTRRAEAARGSHVHVHSLCGRRNKPHSDSKWIPTPISF